MPKVFKNFWLKLSSLLAAVFLSLIVNYFFVSSESNTSVLQVIVPVELKNVPQDRMIIWPPTRQVEVTLQGPTMFLSRVSSPIFRVSIPPDVKNRFTAHLRKEDLNLPSYVQVLNIKPPEIEFTLDQRITRQVPVVVPRIGMLPAEIKIDQTTVTPDTVEVSGPAEEVKNINSVETLPLDLRDIAETDLKNFTSIDSSPDDAHDAVKSARRDLDLRAKGTLSEIKPRQVSVTVDVSLVLAEDKFFNLPIELRSAAGESFSLALNLANVRLSGPRSLVKSLKPSDLIPYVRVDRVEDVPQKAKIFVDAPPRITILGVEPPVVDVIRETAPSRDARKMPAGSVSKKGSPSKKER